MISVNTTSPGTQKGSLFLCVNSGSNLYTMTDEQKQILELYDIMEDRLEKIGITFDQFTILYKSFKSGLTGEEVKVEKDIPANSFPWVKSAGAGWS